MRKDIVDWLSFSSAGDNGLYRCEFAERHIGNTFIRSIHGGVVGSAMEMSAEKLVLDEPEKHQNVLIVTSSIDYLRVTKDQDLYCRAVVTRKSRRIRVVDVSCWQDEETRPVARGIITLRVLPVEA